MRPSPWRWRRGLTYLRLGRIALDADVAFDEHSVCRIYSMTKPVTGLAAILLVEEGKLRFDQPVGDVIPELRTPKVALDPSKGLEARPATQTMTIRHLLTHTAGLAYWTPLHDTDALSAAYRARGITPGNYGAGLTRPGYGPQAVGLDDMVKRLADVPLAAEPARRGATRVRPRRDGPGHPAGQRHAARRLRPRAPLRAAEDGVHGLPGAGGRGVAAHDQLYGHAQRPRAPRPARDEASF